MSNVRINEFGEIIREDGEMTIEELDNVTAGVPHFEPPKDDALTEEFLDGIKAGNFTTEQSQQMFEENEGRSR